MSVIEKFVIDIPQQKLDLLQQKLSLATFPDELDSSEWDYGVPLEDMKRLVAAWRAFDWRAAEQRLNKYPQFHTDISVEDFGDLDIHFVHSVSPVKNAIPLLFAHGWPGSFVEGLKIVEPLTNPPDADSPAFHVVIPSLANYGFSQGVSKRGFALAQHAEVCHKLMMKLGYKEYVTQGGDWGFYITRAMGRLYPASCKASHLNLSHIMPPSHETEPQLAKQWDEIKAKGLDDQYYRDEKRKTWFRKEGMGYNLLQTTKPQTIAYALNDSPVALLAWIYEKLHDWTDSYPWTDAEVIEWISIYYFSRAGPGAASRLYYENAHASPDKQSISKGMSYLTLQQWTDYVKLGFTYNPMELEPVPMLWGRRMGAVVFEAENNHGG